ncbi:hypothetical protein KDW_43400 [Dictyobacter vulcani]|uniref:Carrier domain-containing protein n=1 Tax=Dictyobacter vulcani TaxID=2607529 RepID=A0A5J4KKA3_9CHLR|nr:condensation domain-containing protein [Dictyobacter vulcani]GER90178.1 hypothetical protein KDW_43400 [Dictyobacter vulcani]
MILAANALQLSELDAREEVTLINTVPSAIAELVRSNGLPASIQIVNLAGEPLQRHLVQQIYQQETVKQVRNLYGPTEDTTYSTWTTVAQDDPTVVTIGRPVANTQVYLLNRYLQPVPQGIAGELYLSGSGLARGYLQRPELTAERFVADPFSSEPGARMYRTGDLARYRPDRSIEYLGRIDQQVKVRGFRIELGEIESVLQQHAAIQHAVVMVHEAESLKRLLVYLVVAPGHELPDVQVLREYMLTHVPEYMVPALFVTIDALPLTPNGKIDRKALPTPEQQMLRSHKSFVEPQTALEHTLAAIWRQVLRVEQVSIHDNFFALGGDSIVSLQIVARAKQAGLHVTPKQLFQYPTIAGLAMVVRAETAAPLVDADADALVGPVMLLPIQHWFFEQQLERPEHWNQAVLLNVKRTLEPALLKEAIAHLFSHHATLRLRFIQEAVGWQQQVAELDESQLLTVVDCSTTAVTELSTTIERTAAEVQASLDLSNGPLVRMVYFDPGQEQPARLLIVIHHLVIDGVSWRILLEQLQLICEQLMTGVPVSLPAKTTAYQTWTKLLSEYARRPQVLEQAAYWLAEERQGLKALPRDKATGENTVASTRNIEVSLSREETQSLLYAVPQAYHTQINDVLLTALAQTLAAWSHESAVLINLEGHGREDILEGVDLSATVGWFTSMYPVLLQVADAERPDTLLKSVKEQLFKLPQRGIGYGLLRYLSDDVSLMTQMQALPHAEISFNYLGQFEQPRLEDALFWPASESSGPNSSALNSRQHLLDINGGITNGQLNLSWTYSQNIHEDATIQRLAQEFIQQLRTLIAYCTSDEAGGYTPSDFPLAHLTQEQIDRVLVDQQQIAAVYPLTPLQQGMLFHALYAPNSGDYIVQIGYRFKGNLNVAAFTAAWQQIIKRHDILRTVLVWDGLDEPMQVVHKQVALPFTLLDWRDTPAVVQQAQLAALQASDRAQGFDLAHGPLMRLTLIRCEDDCYEFLWSHHHTLLDGWSLPLVLKEVFDCYEAYIHQQDIQLPALRPYQDYIQWLQQQDTGKVEAYWRQALQGFSTPTQLSIDAGSNAATNHYADQIHEVAPEMTRALQDLARQQQLTLNNLLQGAWALLLASYSRQQDVVFGITASGRSADVAGIESMVGLFINTLPARFKIEPEQDVATWLRTQRDQQTELLQYEYSPLSQVQNWSELPRGTALFEHLFVFENYPITGSGNSGEASLEIQAATSREQTTYPLTLIAYPGQRLALKVLYDQGRFSAHAIAHMLKHLQVLLENIVAAPQRKIAELAYSGEASLEIS